METSGRKVVELNIEDVLPNRFQPRIKFSEDAINELSKSIKEHGVIQPIVVRPIGDKFEIIAGERRYKASCMAGLKTIPALITDLNDKDSAEVALIENVQRENLTPIEEAISYRKILDMGYITQDALATKLGKTQSTIANKLRLLNLDDEVQEALLKEKISERHARSLLRLTDKTKQKEMLNRIISERLPVRKTDEEIDKLLNEPQYENFDFSQTLPPQNIEPEKNDLNIDMEENNEENLKPGKFFNILKEEQEEVKQNKFFNIIDNELKNDNAKENGKYIQEMEENKDNYIKEQNNENSNFNNIFINPLISEGNESNNSLLKELEEIERSIENSNKEELEVNSIQEEIENIDIEEIEETTEELDEPIREKTTSKIHSFKDMLNEVRGCTDKIEEFGFQIETEEFDLGETYQIVIKIKK